MNLWTRGEGVKKSEVTYGSPHTPLVEAHPRWNSLNARNVELKYDQDDASDTTDDGTGPSDVNHGSPGGAEVHASRVSLEMCAQCFV